VVRRVKKITRGKTRKRKLILSEKTERSWEKETKRKKKVENKGGPTNAQATGR